MVGGAGFVVYRNGWLRTLTILGGCLCTLRGRKGRATAQTVHVNPMRAHSMS